MNRRIGWLAWVAASAVILSSGVALAATIRCTADGVDRSCNGTKRADTMTGNELGNVMNGKKGNDRLQGNGGHDWLIGGPGNDQLDGGALHDRLDGGAGNDRLAGGDGSDSYDFFSTSNSDPGWGKDTIVDAKIAVDWRESVPQQISFAFSERDLTVNLVSGPAPEVSDKSGLHTINWDGDVIDGMEGGGGDDKISGNDAPNILNGQEGRDTIAGGGGNDRIDADIRDSPTSTDGDNIDCGDGDDEVIFSGNDVIADNCERQTRE